MHHDFCKLMKLMYIKFMILKSANAVLHLAKAVGKHWRGKSLSGVMYNVCVLY